MSLFHLAGMGWISKALSVAARLGIADHLVEGPRSAEDIARLTETNPDAMRYLMRTLATVGVFEETGDSTGVYRLTETSQQLRDDHPMSMRHWCILGGEMYYDVWRDLLTTVKTGRPASRSEYGSSIYAYMDRTPEAADIYDKAMADITRPAAAEFARDYDFSGMRRIVDIGGGNGHLLSSVLRAHPHLEGIVAERADVAERAARELAEDADADPDLRGRLAFAPCDFFDSVPPGADAYILKNVLHNWSPESSVRILETVRAAMRRRDDGADGAEGAGEPVLFVIEPLLGHDNVSAVRSLFQMVVCEEGTRIRSEDDMRKQAENAGFAIRSIKNLSTEHSVVECVVAH